MSGLPGLRAIWGRALEEISPDADALVRSDGSALSYAELSAAIDLSTNQLREAGAREGIFTVLAKTFPAIFPIKPDLGVFLASSFYLISLAVALLGIYFVLLPKRLERGIKSPNEK